MSTQASDSANTAGNSSDNTNDSSNSGNNSSSNNSDNSSNNNTIVTQYSFPSIINLIKATTPETFFDSTNSSDPPGSTDFPFSTNVRNNFFKYSSPVRSWMNLIDLLGNAEDWITVINANQTMAAACLQADGIEYPVNLPKLGTAAIANTNGAGIGLATDWNAAGSTTTMSLPHYKLFAGCRAIISTSPVSFEFFQVGKGTPDLKEIKFLYWHNPIIKIIIMASPSPHNASKTVIDGIMTFTAQTYDASVTWAYWDYRVAGSAASNNLTLSSNTLGSTNGVFDGSKASAVVQFRADENTGIFQMTAAGLNTGFCGIRLVANKSSYFIEGAVETLATAPTESGGIYTLTSNCAITKPSFAGSGSALDTASTNGLGSSDYTLYATTVGGFARAANDQFQVDTQRILSYSASSANTFGTGTGPNLSITTDGQNTVADLTTTPPTPRRYGIVPLLGLGDISTIDTPAAADITDISDMLN